MNVSLKTVRIKNLGSWLVIIIFCLAININAEITNVRTIIVTDRRSTDT